MHNDVGGIAVHSIYHTAQALAPTQTFMSMWRAPKPVIAQVHGWCVGGGSDTALCADLVRPRGCRRRSY